MLTEIWRRAVSEQPPPSATAVTVTAVLALLLVVSPSFWRATRYLVTVSHEGGHALVALLVGRRLRGIRLHSDTSGLTVSSGRPSGPGMVAMLAAGYLAPAVTGLAAAALLLSGHALGLLWLLVGWLLLMLAQIRNAYGIAVVVGCAGVLAAITWFAAADTQATVASLITWLLLVAAPKPLLELAVQRRRGRARHSDVDQLARLTRVPGLAWLGGFLLANLAGLALGVVLLLPAVVELVTAGVQGG